MKLTRERRQKAISFRIKTVDALLREVLSELGELEKLVNTETSLSQVFAIQNHAYDSVRALTDLSLIPNPFVSKKKKKEV